ncbi:MAG: RNA 2',3'-cyclic phosphodiesterase [Nocardioides sp.]|uniref:RNA 2',3'-cyclic phosphodiesterase n=1 Tax=Nocardioides sp. TaxID=35761 RepID=UPI0039E5F455
MEDLDEFLDVRRSATAKGGDALRWSLPEQLHVTLAFLAEVPDRRLDDLEAGLERAARKRTAFSTRIAGGGAFPNAARARVLWAGLDLTDDSHEELRRLATGARASANRAGIAVDGQRFRPHITVARTGRPTEVTSWMRLLDSYAGPEWPAHDIELVASHLGEGPRGRPRYETVAAFALDVP